MSFQSGGPGWNNQITPLYFSGGKSGSGPKPQPAKKKEKTDEAKFSSQVEIDLDFVDDSGSKSIFQLIKDFFIFLYKRILKFFEKKPEAKKNIFINQ